MFNMPLQNPISAQSGLVTQPWAMLFQNIIKLLSADMPWKLASMTVAQLPNAAKYEGCLVYVSNESGGKTVAFSDGTNWRRVQDRAICS